MFKTKRMVREYVERAFLPVGDYVSPDFSIILPDQCFPNLIVGDKRASRWPYFRREIPHNRYVDKRWPDVGFLNRDEAHILYNTALNFKGKRALEIGCWLGWSACHLALAGVALDVIDPLLARPEFYESVSSSLRAAGVLETVNLIPGYSPQKVEELATQLKRKWSLIFIDGNHDAPGPLNDAIACEQLAAEDASILFHDLASPEVAQGLDYLKQKGWNTTIYQTAQIIGVAWRGNVEPVRHQPDPKVQWHLPEHLKHYSVSGLEIDLPKKHEPQLDSSQSLIYQVIEQLNANNNAQALKLLEKAIAARPDMPGLNYGKAVALARNGCTNEAIEALNHLLNILPRHRKGRQLLTELRSGMITVDRASRIYPEGLDIHTRTEVLSGAVQSQIAKLPLRDCYRSKINQLVSDNPGQLSFDEYSYITDTIIRKPPGNFLIFGMGKDSELWIEVNKNGKTVFLEDDRDWLTKVMVSRPGIEAYLVEYGTQRKDWVNLLFQYNQKKDCLSMELPDSIIQTKWNFIFVDAPPGYSDEMPGRMKSIYMAAKLAYKSENTDVFIHDCDRLIENIYAGYFFRDENFIAQVQRLKHYKIVF